jgi:hypothetical protein
MKLGVKLLIITSLLSILNASLFDNAYTYDPFFEDPTEAGMYLKLSELIKSTGNNVNQTIQAIQSGDTETALHILSNVTDNIQEISNGLDVFASVQISSEETTGD